MTECRAKGSTCELELHLKRSQCKPNDINGLLKATPGAALASSGCISSAAITSSSTSMGYSKPRQGQHLRAPAASRAQPLRAHRHQWVTQSHARGSTCELRLHLKRSHYKPIDINGLFKATPVATLASSGCISSAAISSPSTSMGYSKPRQGQQLQDPIASPAQPLRARRHRWVTQSHAMGTNHELQLHLERSHTSPSTSMGYSKPRHGHQPRAPAASQAQLLRAHRHRWVTQSPTWSAICLAFCKN